MDDLLRSERIVLVKNTDEAFFYSYETRVTAVSVENQKYEKYYFVRLNSETIINISTFLSIVFTHKYFLNCLYFSYS